MTANSGSPEADKQSWVQGGSYRLRISPFISEEKSESPILVVVVHGDAPFHKPDYQNVFAAKVAATHRDVVAIGLLRPGYTDPQGNQSEGERGQATGDNWNIINTESIADAIAELRRRWKARKVVVAAHSGGAALVANILGRYPELIGGALLVSSAYDVEKWRQYMFEQTGVPVFQGKIDTLSPIEQITGISEQVEITLMVGSEDEICPPRFSEQYKAVARNHGKNVRLVQLEGEEHNMFLSPSVFAELSPMLR